MRQTPQFHTTYQITGEAVWFGSPLNTTQREHIENYLSQALVEYFGAARGTITLKDKDD